MSTFFIKIDRFVTKATKNHGYYLLAPKLSKTLGAEAPIASIFILTMALQRRRNELKTSDAIFLQRLKSQEKSKEVTYRFHIQQFSQKSSGAIAPLEPPLTTALLLNHIEQRDLVSIFSIIL